MAGGLHYPRNTDADGPFALAWRMSGYQRDKRYIQAMVRREYGVAPSLSEIDAMFSRRDRLSAAGEREHYVKPANYNPENDNGQPWRPKQIGKPFEHMLRLSRGLEWPCTHQRTDLNTHRVGSTVSCRVCRRARLRTRIRTIMRKEAARLAVIEARATEAARRRDKREALDRQLAAQKTLEAAKKEIVENGRLPFDKLLKAVAAHFDLSPAEITGPGRRRELVHARAVVVQILRHRRLSYPTIGRLLGGRDHSSIIHAFDRFPDYCAESPFVATAYRACSDRVARHG